MTKRNGNEERETNIFQWLFHNFISTQSVTQDVRQYTAAPLGEAVGHCGSGTEKQI